MEKLVEELKGKICVLNERFGHQRDLDDDVIDKLYSVFPFNKFEYVISRLISSNVIDFAQYLEIRNQYLERNKFLYVFEITAPRTFGETWAQRHLNELVPELRRPSASLDGDYSGQYDFWYNGIRIEVKASRAVADDGSGDPLIVKALSSDSNCSFNMNFQQIKPDCCDVFVWIGVWRDTIRYWVLSSNDVRSNKYYSKGQHRGNMGEGQLWVKDSNIDEFAEYETGPRCILQKIEQRFNS